MIVNVEGRILGESVYNVSARYKMDPHNSSPCRVHHIYCSARKILIELKQPAK